MKNIKDSKKRFALGMGIYAAVFILLTLIGLIFFWDFIDNYEKSLPSTALENYNKKLTTEYITNASQALINQVDHTLQSEDACKQVIADSLKNGVTFVKKLKESTDTKFSYNIVSNRQIIGSVVFEKNGDGDNTSSPWEITEEIIDLSHLLNELSFTVPADYTVTVASKTLDSEYVTNDKLPYSIFGELYKLYPTLPYLKVYTVGTILGDAEVSITDGNGQPVTVPEGTDFNTLLPACTEAQTAAIKAKAEEFVTLYSAYTTQRNRDLDGNYYRLCNILEPNELLFDQMKRAKVSIGEMKDNQATITSKEILRIADVGNNRFVCELTYSEKKLDMGKEPWIEPKYHVVLILVQEGNQLLVENMQSNEIK